MREVEILIKGFCKAVLDSRPFFENKTAAKGTIMLKGMKSFLNPKALVKSDKGRVAAGKDESYLLS